MKTEIGIMPRGSVEWAMTKCDHVCAHSESRSADVPVFVSARDAFSACEDELHDHATQLILKVSLPAVTVTTFAGAQYRERTELQSYHPAENPLAFEDQVGPTRIERAWMGISSVPKPCMRACKILRIERASFCGDKGSAPFFPFPIELLLLRN